MFIIGCCNNNSGLYLYDETKNEILDKKDIYLTRGITFDINNNIYIVKEMEGIVCKYNENFKLIKTSEYIDIYLHDLFLYKNKLYLADSKNDKIHIMDPNDLTILNSYNLIHENINTNDHPTLYHINDIWIQNDTIYFTKFRDDTNFLNYIEDKQIDNMGSLHAKNINDFSNNLGNKIISNLSQPHNPYIYKSKIYCCDSKKNSIFDYNLNKNIITTKNFTRGLYIENDILYVGVSTLLNRPHNPNYNPNDICLLEIYDLKENTIINNCKIHSNEIYTIKKLPTGIKF